MVGCVTSLAIHGVEARPIAVEVDIQSGLPSFHIVGLPDAAVREARARVRAAIRNSELEFPLRRITVNLAPADLPKVGPGFDLAVAAGILIASGQLNRECVEGVALCGELALDGGVRPLRGAVAVAMAARAAGLRGLVVPAANAGSARLVGGIRVAGVERLRRIVDGLDDESWATREGAEDGGTELADQSVSDEAGDLVAVRGHVQAKRALELAAAGGHNVLLYGPPGTGKTMLARRLGGILPPLSVEEALEVTAIHSVAGAAADGGLVRSRPFRSPHHSISTAGMVGGGSLLMPGEVSLAHRGVLFLDELAEFSRGALEALRQPLEDGVVRLSRAVGQVRFPCSFALVAACNPCPCGHLGDEARSCSCSMSALARYRSRLSGPLMDRIDLVIRVPRPHYGRDVGCPAGETSATVRQRVIVARRRQHANLKRFGARCNAEIEPTHLAGACTPSAGALEMLERSADRFALSGRAVDRALRVARTAADLDGRDRVESRDVAEALSYRAFVNEP